MKPKIAFLISPAARLPAAVVNLEAEMVDLLNAVEIVQFREALSEKARIMPSPS